MKLTTKKLKELIKEELSEIEEKVDYSPQGGGGALLDSDYVSTTCREISQGIRPGRMSDEEYERAKQRCEDQRNYSPAAMAAREKEAEAEREKRRAAQKEIEASIRSKEKFINKFVEVMNTKKEYYIDTFFSGQMEFKPQLYDAETTVVPLTQMMSDPKNRKLFSANLQYTKSITKQGMEAIENAGGFGNFLKDTGVYVGSFGPEGKPQGKKVYLDPDKYIETYMKLRNITKDDLKDESPSSNKKGFFGKLKSLVGLEESNFSITSEQLRQIVNEELKSVMKEKQKK